MAEKAKKLGTMRVTIFHLFQCMNTQLNANLSVPVDDSHTQLHMIELFIHNLQDICMEARQNNMWEGQRATRLGSIRDMPA
ncbi:coiled-coil domain-containing protein 42-like [Rhynochetos jubatus]